MSCQNLRGESCPSLINRNFAFSFLIDAHVRMKHEAPGYDERLGALDDIYSGSFHYALGMYLAMANTETAEKTFSSALTEVKLISLKSSRLV